MYWGTKTAESQTFVHASPHLIELYVYNLRAGYVLYVPLLLAQYRLNRTYETKIMFMFAALRESVSGY